MESSYLREQARFSLAGKWGLAVLTTFIAALLGGLVTRTGNKLSFNAEDVARAPEQLHTFLNYILAVSVMLGFVQFIVGGVVELGYSRFLLNLQDEKEAKVGDLFSQFDRFGDGFYLALLRGLFTALWTLLFIIPGIVASYSYAMAGFILAENPGLTAREALRDSKELMRGHKFDLFCLNLSFIGWALLSVLTLGIGTLWLNPYRNAAQAAFYRSLVH